MPLWCNALFDSNAFQLCGIISLNLPYSWWGKYGEIKEMRDTKKKHTHTHPRFFYFIFLSLFAFSFFFWWKTTCNKIDKIQQQQQHRQKCTTVCFFSFRFFSFRHLGNCFGYAFIFFVISIRVIQTHRKKVFDKKKMNQNMACFPSLFSSIKNSIFLLVGLLVNI